MNKYIIYTFEGNCQDPYGNDIFNCQLLGRIVAYDKEEAIQKFIAENEWVSRSGFSPDRMRAAQLHDSEDAD